MYRFHAVEDVKKQECPQSVSATSKVALLQRFKFFSNINAETQAARSNVWCVQCCNGDRAPRFLVAQMLGATMTWSTKASWLAVLASESDVISRCTLGP